MISIVFVTWVSTQVWVGISYCERSPSSMSSKARLFATLSVAGLIPITASPVPYSSPSSVETAMPRRSSVGWFGCSREASVPRRPIVLRNRVTTRIFDATTIRSWLRISLLTAAAISGVTPGAIAASVISSAACDSSQSRHPPTVRCEMAENAVASWVSTISRVTSSTSYGTSASSRMSARRTSASAYRAAMRSASLAAPSPARLSPERAGEAAASSALRSSNRYRVPSRLE